MNELSTGLLENIIIGWRNQGKYRSKASEGTEGIEGEAGVFLCCDKLCAND